MHEVLSCKVKRKQSALIIEPEPDQSKSFTVYGSSVPACLPLSQAWHRNRGWFQRDYTSVAALLTPALCQIRKGLRHMWHCDLILSGPGDAHKDGFLWIKKWILPNTAARTEINGFLCQFFCSFIIWGLFWKTAHYSWHFAAVGFWIDSCM